MAVLNKDDFLLKVKERIGEDESDEALSFIEDMTDTYTALEASSGEGGEDWESKYNELDASWRKKYKERFFNAETKTEPEEEPEEEKEDIQIEDLFKKEEE